MTTRIIQLLAACLFAGLFLSATAYANDGHDRTQFGNAINVEPGEEITEAVCFGCSVHVRGHVKGDVTAFGGSVIIEDQGQVGGDATVFAGDLRLEKSAAVKGELAVFGGHIYRDPAASVGGDVTNFGGGSVLWLFLIFGLPLVLFGGVIFLIVLLIRRLLQPAAPVTA
jgi:hypothetical protein